MSIRNKINDACPNVCDQSSKYFHINKYSIVDASQIIKTIVMTAKDCSSYGTVYRRIFMNSFT